MVKRGACPYCLSFLIRIYFIVSIKISSLSCTSFNFWTLSVVIKQNSNKPRTIIVATERQKSDLCPKQAATQQTKGLCECVYVIYRAPASFRVLISLLSLCPSSSQAYILLDCGDDNICIPDLQLSASM